ncbi:MAG TPA: HAMP domain-containing sensor histidine kinase [Gammaproteobacteria bacterium]
MNSSEKLKFEFGQTSWRQSIAVKITAQIIWVIVPIVFVSSIFLFDTIEKDQSQSFLYKTDVLVYRVSNTILHSRLAVDEKDALIAKIAAELDFKAIEVSAPNYQLTNKVDTTGYVPIKHTLPIINADDGFENAFIEITSYHVPLERIIEQQRKDFLAVIFLCLIIFAVFLVMSIRIWLYKPLKTLVDATETVASGNTNVDLDADRKDEFGHLSLFFYRMLDSMIEQHNTLREAAKAASEANNAKSIFLANMSHELRTPLNAIIGYSEMMLDEAKDRNDRTYIEDLEKTISASRHLLHLINEVLDLSKIEAGKMETHISKFNIQDMIQEIVTTLEPLARQRNNTLNIEFDSSITTIHSDSMKVRQILINLLGNACKFTENGLITLKARQLIKNSHRYLALSVSDTGIGIKTENINLLFKPFTQQDNSSTRSYSGTGLGLSICHHLCILLGGKIDVQSDLGKGSCFTVTIPIDSEKPQAISFMNDSVLPKVSSGG